MHAPNLYAIKADGYDVSYAAATPTPLSKASGDELRDVLQWVGDSIEAACFRVKDGTVWCQRGNFWGTLGNGSFVDSSSAVQVMTSASTPLTRAETLSMGGGTACAVRTDGSVYCWGRENSNQIPDTAVVDLNANGYATRIPLANPNTAAGKAVRVVVDASTVAIMLDGSVRTWGVAVLDAKGGSLYNKGPACAQTDNTICNPAPTWNDMVGASVGMFFTCLLRKAGGGTVWCVGTNDAGQVGSGAKSNTAVSSWTQVKKSGGTFLTGVTELESAGSSSCALIGTDGSVWCWGKGALGSPSGQTSSSRPSPYRSRPPRGLPSPA